MSTSDTTQSLTPLSDTPDASEREMSVHKNSVREQGISEAIISDDALNEVATGKSVSNDAVASEDAPTMPLTMLETDESALASLSENSPVVTFGTMPAQMPAQTTMAAPDVLLEQLAGEPLPYLQRRRFHLRRWHIVVSVVLLIMIAVASVSGTFFWNRWHRYNDAQDIQGTWYVAGSQVAIDISSDQLIFNKNTAYTYTIDSETKTILFTLGNMDGLAHYCFFENREVLVIVDGREFTRWGTAGNDFLLSLERFALLSEGRIPGYPEGEGMIVLARTPDKYTWGDFSYKFVDAADDAAQSSTSAGESSAGDAQESADNAGETAADETDANTSDAGDISGSVSGDASDASATSSTSSGDSASGSTGAPNDPSASASSNSSSADQFQELNDV